MTPRHISIPNPWTGIHGIYSWWLVTKITLSPSVLYSSFFLTFSDDAQGGNPGLAALKRTLCFSETNLHLQGHYNCLLPDVFGQVHHQQVAASVLFQLSKGTPKPPQIGKVTSEENPIQDIVAKPADCPSGKRQLPLVIWWITHCEIYFCIWNLRGSLSVATISAAQSCGVLIREEHPTYNVTVSCSVRCLVVKLCNFSFSFKNVTSPGSNCAWSDLMLEVLSFLLVEQSRGFGFSERVSYRQKTPLIFLLYIVSNLSQTCISLCESFAIVLPRIGTNGIWWICHN